VSTARHGYIRGDGGRAPGVPKLSRLVSVTKEPIGQGTAWYVASVWGLRRTQPSGPGGPEARRFGPTIRKPGAMSAEHRHVRPPDRRDALRPAASSLWSSGSVPRAKLILLHKPVTSGLVQATFQAKGLSKCVSIPCRRMKLGLPN
jgi:hypothetical protein